MRMKIFRIVTAVLLVSLMIAIFCFSAQNATESSGTSGRVISAFIRIFNPSFDELTPQEQQNLIEPFQFIVRKGAHFSVYALMGLLAFFSVITYKQLNIKYRYILSGGICLIYAISDEIHQHFIVGRSCELRDVLIDFSGSVLSIIFITLLLKLKIFRKFKAVLF